MGVIPGFVEYADEKQRQEWLQKVMQPQGDDDEEESNKGGRSSALLERLFDHAKAVLERRRPVWIGVYCQPYYVNEDSLAAIDLYHALLHQEERFMESRAGEERESLVQAFILADYANPDRGTRVWHLKGRKHDQDLAVMKEVARFRGHLLPLCSWKRTRSHQKNVQVQAST